MNSKNRGGVASPKTKVTGRLSKMSAQATHKYCDFFTTNVTATTHFAYRGNGMYDPDVSVGGHQPLGFDQYAGLFDEFLVHSSDIEVVTKGFRLGADSAVSPCIVAVWADDSSSYPGSVSLIHETCLARGGIYTQTGNSYKNQLPIRLSARTVNQLANAEPSELVGRATGDPVKTWYWHVVLINPDLTFARTHEVELALSYNSVWSQPKLLASS